jgi:chromate reductase
VLLQPEVLVARAHDKFDGDGRLTDATTRKFLMLFLGAFAEWIARWSERRALAVAS